MGIVAMRLFFDACDLRQAGPELTQQLSAIVRDAVASPSFSKDLVASLDGMHCLDSGAKSPKSMRLLMVTSPETAVPAVLQKLVRVPSQHYQQLLCSQPKLRSSTHSTNGTPPAVHWPSVAFVDALCRLAPVEMMEAVKQPLLDWDALPSQVRTEPKLMF
jgi:hypothetical protein